MKGVLFLLIAGSCFLGRVHAEEKSEMFDFRLAGTNLKPLVRPIHEQVYSGNGSKPSFDRRATWKNRLLIGGRWTSNGAEFEAGIRLNSKTPLHFEMRE